MKTDASELFRGLGDRFWKENDLSDVTYAMCRGSKVFFQFFLDFFFGEFSLNAEGAEIAREVDDGTGNRPDFRIETKDHGVFYVEVKIGDGWQHFSEYYESLRNANPEDGANMEKTRKRLGYIVNYVLSWPGYVVHRWEELAEQLKRYDYFNDDVIQGYAEFVRSVCGLRGTEDIDFYRFNPKDFVDIRLFMDEVLASLEAHRSEGVTPYNRNRAKCFSLNFKMGKVFQLDNFRGSGKSVWGWLGCFINDVRAEVVVQFENQRGWGDLVCQGYTPPHKQERSVYYDDYDNALYFYMVESDKDISAFLGRVLREINGSYDPQKVPVFPSDIQFDRYKPLLSLRRFPKAVKKFFFAGLNGLENGRLIQVTGQDDWPYSQCHVTFQIQKTEGGTETKTTGWVGVDYGRDSTSHELLVPQFRFAFADEAPMIIAPPNDEGNMHAWAESFRKQLTAKLHERDGKNCTPNDNDER